MGGIERGAKSKKKVEEKKVLGGNKSFEGQKEKHS